MFITLRGVLHTRKIGLALGHLVLQKHLPFFSPGWMSFLTSWNLDSSEVEEQILVTKQADAK